MIAGELALRAKSKTLPLVCLAISSTPGSSAFSTAWPVGSTMSTGARTALAIVTSSSTYFLPK